MGDLSSNSQQLAKIGLAAEFLKELETTAMTRSYKMLVVLAMLNSNCFPGEISIDRLCDGVRRLARRSAALLRDLAVPLDDSQALETKLVRNPIHFWEQGKGTSWVSETASLRPLFISQIKTTATTQASFESSPIGD